MHSIQCHLCTQITAVLLALKCNTVATITGSPCPTMIAAVAAVFLSSVALAVGYPRHASSPHVPTAYAE